MAFRLDNGLIEKCENITEYFRDLRKYEAGEMSLDSESSLEKTIKAMRQKH